MNPDGRPNPQQTMDKILVRLERDERIIELTRRGQTIRAIAREVGCDTGTVLHTRKKAIAEARDAMFADVRMYTAESMERLSALLDAIWDRAMTGDHQHVAEARRIIAEMAAFTGAKAPIRVEIQESAVDAALRELAAELDRRAGGAAGETVALEGTQGRG